jgi:peptidyl-prolyl cis-trans isomerase B (cyclophilin B)
VASSKTRQRKLARAKLHRQLARQADQQRRSRRVRAGLAVFLTVALVGVGSAWLLGAFDKEPTTTPETQCLWTKQDPASNADLKDVGTPAENGLPTTGRGDMTLTLNTGTVKIDLDRPGSTCASASLAYLAAQNYYANTPCFSVTHTPTDGYALLCGDHTGKGTGGAAYTFYQEVTAEQITPPSPTASPAPSATPQPSQLSLFKKGTVAMNPGSSGSQFMIFYQDSQVDTATHPYTVVGQVTSGLPTIEAIAKAGTVKNEVGVDVKPKSPVTIQSVAVVDGVTPSSSATPSGTPAAASPSASAS